MEKKKDLLCMVYQVQALASAIADAYEDATSCMSKGVRDEVNKLGGLVYLLEDFMDEVQEEAENRLDFPDNRFAAVQRENEKLRKTIIELELKICS